MHLCSDCSVLLLLQLMMMMMMTRNVTDVLPKILCLCTSNFPNFVDNFVHFCTASAMHVQDVVLSSMTVRLSATHWY